MMLRWMALTLAALALGAGVEAAPLKMWDEVVNRPIETLRLDLPSPDARDAVESATVADDRATGRTGSWDPVVDPAFETILRSETLPIISGQGRPGAPTLPVPEATTLLFVGLALAGVASGRKLFKR